MTIQDINTIIRPILLKYGIPGAGIFGSYAGNMADESSDVDIIQYF